MGIQLFEKSCRGNKQKAVKALTMVHKQAIFLLISLFMSAQNWGESQFVEISGSPMKLENGNEHTGKKRVLLFLLKRKRLIKIPSCFPH